MHGEVGHVGCAILEGELALEVVQDDMVEEYLGHVDIHVEVDVLGHYDDSHGGIVGVIGCCFGGIGCIVFAFGRGHEVVEVHVAALEVELSLEGLILEGKGHVVLETAVGSDVVLPDEHAGLAQVEVAGGEGKGRLLYSYLGKAFNEHLHIL